MKIHLSISVSIILILGVIFWYLLQKDKIRPDSESMPKTVNIDVSDIQAKNPDGNVMLSPEVWDKVDEQIRANQH